MQAALFRMRLEQSPSCRRGSPRILLCSAIYFIGRFFVILGCRERKAYEMERKTLKLNSILYIESRGKKVEVHTTDMEDIIESTQKLV